MAANKEKQTHSVVSYFCGCGGLDLGFRGGFNYHNEQYKKLPFDIVKAYDFEPKCVETYNDYFGKDHAEVKDLSKAVAKDMPKADILIGGFPCQEFSSCGPLGGLESERGKLYKTMIEYMNAHRPKVVVGENVINLERMQQGEVLKVIEKDLIDAGYEVQVWKMFAPEYGIPQRRTRLIIVCVRKDIFDTYGFPEKPDAQFADHYRSIEWAIGDLVEVTDNEVVPNQGDYFAASKAKRGNGQGDESNEKDKPAYTIRANPKSRVQFHYSLDRRLTVRECARIQTFPDDFIFKFSKTTNISQIGNAVPPVLAYRVAESIADYMKKIGGAEK